MSSYTYSGDPSTSTLDRVRFLLQDTADPGLLTDSEVAWLLSEEGDNAYQAAYQGCLILARKYAGQPGGRSIGDVHISHADLTKRYTDLAPSLLARAGRASVPTPYLGGLYQGDKEANDSNDAHVERQFTSDEQWDNPR